MADEKSKIELRSDDVEDILGRVPGWITRNGILMLFLVVSILFFSAWIFKVPDVKRAGISVTTLLPAVDIEARSDGNIVELFVSDNQMVEKDEILAVIENPADYKDVLALKELLGQIKIPVKDLPLPELPVNGDAELGMLQSAYAAFYKSVRDYTEFVQLNYHQRKIDLLIQENEQYLDYSLNLDNRAAILREEYELSENQYRRDSTLFLQGVVSESDFESTRSQMLSKRGDWQEILSLKAENEIKIAGIREQILEMELKRQEQTSMLSTSLEEALNKLKGNIASWEKQFLIVTPISGQVTFNRIWSENQNARAGEKVMTVIPDKNSDLLGKIMLPMKGAGEVKTGQPVNIRFENFPYLEYGMVRGVVSNVSKVPQNNFYTVEVRLPEGLTTYYGYNIDFSQNMQGEAEILTDKMRLLQRIFSPVRSAISRQREM